MIGNTFIVFIVREELNRIERKFYCINVLSTSSSHNNNKLTYGVVTGFKREHESSTQVHHPIQTKQQVEHTKAKLLNTDNTLIQTHTHIHKHIQTQTSCHKIERPTSGHSAADEAKKK